jgi:prenyltransferase beta subunit
MKPLLPNIFENVVVFVMARWQPSGGFGFVPSLPASVEDTYQALQILETIQPVSERELQELKGNTHLKAFLMHNDDKETWSLRTAYQYLAVCAFCGVCPDRGWTERFLGKKLKEVVSLGERYCLTRIRREYPSLVAELLRRTGPVTPSMDDGRILDGEQSESWRTAEELWMHLYLHGGSEDPLRATKEELIGWLQACQTPDGGFGGLPGTTSFIENTHWCLRALALLEGAPLFPDMAQDFILRCKTRGGGFARKSGGAPFLYATWHAVAGLTLLHDMEGTEQNETMLTSER